MLLHCDVNDGVRSRGFLLRALAVEFEPPEREDAEVEAPIEVMEEDRFDGLFIPGIEDHDDDCVVVVAFTPTVGIGNGGTDANLSRLCNVLSLCFCGKVGGTSLVARRSFGGVFGGIKLPVEIDDNEGEGAMNVGVTGEPEVI